MTLSVEVAPIDVNLSVPDIAIQAKHRQPLRINVLSAVVDTLAGATTTVTIPLQPTNGTAIVQKNQINYRPLKGAFTTDSILYTVTDNFGDSMSGTITITFS